MKYFEDYTSYTNSEANELLEQQIVKEGKFLLNPEGVEYKIEMVIVMPAHPLLQNILTQMMSAVSLHLISEQLLMEFQANYLLDEYIVGAISTANAVGGATPFHILPLRQVVGVNGDLYDDFLKEGWHYLD